MDDLAKALTAGGGSGPQQLTGAPCRITQVSPLLIDFYSSTTYPAVKLPGMTYTIGAGYAILPPGAKPIVLPLGI